MTFAEQPSLCCHTLDKLQRKIVFCWHEHFSEINDSKSLRASFIICRYVLILVRIGTLILFLFLNILDFFYWAICFFRRIAGVHEMCSVIKRIKNSLKLQYQSGSIRCVRYLIEKKLLKRPIKIKSNYRQWKTNF